MRSRSSGWPHADDAGRADEHLLRLQVEEPRRLGGRRLRVEQAPLAGRGIRAAGVEDDRLRLRLGEVPLRDDDRRGQDAVAREHRRTDCRHGRADECEVEALLLQAGGDAARDEALGIGDAHTVTPWSRRPSVSSKPSQRFAFWIS